VVGASFKRRRVYLLSAVPMLRILFTKERILNIPIF
jgi:hypothetical protein